MDIDIGTGLNRANTDNGPDRMEKREKEFHERVRNGYLELAAKSPDVIKIVKVEEKIEDTYEKVREKIYDLIEKNKRAD